MNKKILGILVALGLIFAGSAMAEELGAGCGAGKMILEGKTTKGAHILAATINGIYSNHTFAMTSGTWGCDTDSVILKEHEAEVFVAVNLAPLTQEMAQGSGARLKVLAGLMGCSATASSFAGMTQARFEALPLANGESPVTLVNALRQEIKADAALAAACNPVG